MKTVVVVDDEPITRLDICSMLEDLGFVVAGQASDGYDAIELCRRTNPDVLLLDVKMPVFDGLTAADEICRNDYAGCVVMLTAFTDKDIVSRAIAAGVNGYIVKPVDPQKLLPTIEVAYEQANRLRKLKCEAEKAERKVLEDRAIHKAQKLLACRQNCTESEAYEEMRKLAMNKRVTVFSIAQAIIGQEAQ